MSDTIKTQDEKNNVQESVRIEQLKGQDLAWAKRYHKGIDYEPKPYLWQRPKKDIAWCEVKREKSKAIHRKYLGVEPMSEVLRRYLTDYGERALAVDIIHDLFFHTDMCGIDITACVEIAEELGVIEIDYRYGGMFCRIPGASQRSESSSEDLKIMMQQIREIDEKIKEKLAEWERNERKERVEGEKKEEEGQV